MKRKRKSYYSRVLKNGTMKSIPFILLAFTLIFGFYGISSYIEANKQTWAMQASIEMYQQQRLFEEQLKKEQADAEWWVANGWLVKGTSYSLVFVIATSAASYTMWHLRNKRIENSLRAKEGMFPLQLQDMKVINPNILTDGITEIGNQQKMLPAPAQYQLQSQALVNQGKAQITQATSNQQIKYAVHGKFLAGAFDRPIKPAEFHVVEDEEEDVVSYQQISLDEAIKLSTKESWVLGHCLVDNTTCNFTLKDVIHLAIVGGSGVGKTSYTAFHVMYMALKNGFKVIALDAKNGIDWQRFAEIIEATKTNKSMFPQQLESIFNEFKRRMKLLENEGVDEINRMRNPPQKILIILEEFSTLINEFDSKKTDKVLVEKIYKMIDIMLKQGRAVGMHFCVIDQDNNTWTSTMKKMLRGLFLYNLGGYGASSFTPQERIPVEERGQFAYKGKAYNSWLVADKIDGMMGTITLPKTDYKLLPVIEDDKPSYDISLVAPNTSTDTKQLKVAKTYENTANLLPQVQSASASAGVSVSASTNSSAEVYQQIIDNALANKIGVLDGKPESKYEKNLVYNIWLITQDKTKVCEVCWGSKNSKRWKWVNEIIMEMIS